MNRVILKGRLGSDPEVRYTPNGSAVANVSIAMTERWTDKQGNKQERTEWMRLTIWGKRGEAFANYHQKGAEALVTGKLRTSEWEKDGVKQRRTEVEVDDWEFIGGGNQQNQQNQPRGNANYGETGSGGYDNAGDPGLDDDDSLPF